MAAVADVGVDDGAAAAVGVDAAADGDGTVADGDDWRGAALTVAVCASSPEPTCGAVSDHGSRRENCADG